MDTADYPSLPNLARMHSRLAVDSRRVEQLVDRHLDAIERLFDAAVAEDWSGIASATKMLAGLSPEATTADVVSADVLNEARQLYEELTHTPRGTKQPKHLAGLLDACRRFRLSRRA